MPACATAWQPWHTVGHAAQPRWASESPKVSASLAPSLCPSFWPSLWPGSLAGTPHAAPFHAVRNCANNRRMPASRALSPAAATPERLEVNARAHSVGIDWADGHHSAFPFWYLRGFCPCAVCQGHGGAGRFVPPAAQLTLKDVHEVGHYALNFVWDDGHRTGIYAHGTLRQMCPCTPCRADAGGAHPWHALTPERQADLTAAPAH